MGNTFHLGQEIWKHEPIIVNVDKLSWGRKMSSIIVADALICEWGKVSPMYQYFIQKQARGFMQRG